MIRFVKKLWLEAKRRDRKRRRRSSGFTMLEIMIVIAIIAALGAGVGVVVFQNFKKAQVKIAVREGRSDEALALNATLLDLERSERRELVRRES